MEVGSWKPCLCEVVFVSRIFTMGSVFDNVLVNAVLENGTAVRHIQGKVQLRLSYDPAGISVKVFQGKSFCAICFYELPQL